MQRHVYLIIICLAGLLLGCGQSTDTEIEMNDPETTLLRRNSVRKGTVSTLKDGWSIGLEGIYSGEYFDQNGDLQTGKTARFSVWGETMPAGEMSRTFIVPLHGRFMADQPYQLVEIDSDEIVFAEVADPEAAPLPWNAIAQGPRFLIKWPTFLSVQQVYEGEYTDAQGQPQRGPMARIVLNNTKAEGPEAQQTLELPVQSTFTIEDQTFTLTEIILPTGDSSGWIVLK